MHKTHVMLEDWQYEALQTLAEQEHRSISDLVREMLTRYLVGNHEIARQRLAAMEGIGADAHATGQDHDAVGVAPAESEEDDGNAATEAHKPGAPGMASGGTDFLPAGKRRLPTRTQSRRPRLPDRARTIRER